MENLTYKDSGVNYDLMDPFKRKAQIAARMTAGNINRFNFEEIVSSRGESAYLIKTPIGIFAHVEEGLGTKNLVADAMYTLTGKSYYDHIGQDTIAMIVNDMVTLGVMPVSVAMHLAVESSEWFTDNTVKVDDLIIGWRNACDLSRCAWGGGETPTLKGIIQPGTALLSGSGIGFAKILNEERVQPGDSIVLLQSSGIHANGLTAARKIADKLPEGYLTKLSDGRGYGESLLDPTNIYVGVMEDLLNARFRIHYAANITGHGWRKLMRLDKNFTYRIHTIFPPLPIFDFMQQHGPIDDEEAYGNFNMGAGFALFVKTERMNKGHVDEIVKYINDGEYQFKAINAGFVEEGEKQVIIEPKNLVYKGETLGVR